MSERTEEPTPRRLRKAADEGDVAQSASLSSACGFLAASLLVPPLARALSSWAHGALASSLSLSGGSAALDAGALASGAIASVVALSAPAMAAAAATAALVSAVQAGGVLSFAKLSPDLAKLSPGKGLSGLVSPERLLGVVRGALTLALFVALARSRLRDHLPDLAAASLSPERAAGAGALLASALLRDAGLLLLASGAVDFALARRSFLERLKMTREEIKQESKESEGDPQLKAARERAHHELLAQASIHAVKDATVVVVNPTHLATALRYRDGEDEAPTLVAKGDGALAARIVEAARHYNVPVVQDIPLARALHELEVGDQIPEALYEAVAEVLRSLWGSVGDEGEGEPAGEVGGEVGGEARPPG